MCGEVSVSCMCGVHGMRCVMYVYMFVHLRVRRFSGAVVTRETGYGCLVTPGRHSFPIRSHSLASPSVASKEGLITVS